MLSLIEHYTGSKRAREASKSFYEESSRSQENSNTSRHSINEEEAPLM